MQRHSNRPGAGDKAQQLRALREAEYERRQVAQQAAEAPRPPIDAAASAERASVLLAVVRGHRDSALLFAAALAEIRDDQLFLHLGYKSFSAFLAKEAPVSRGRAYQMITEVKEWVSSDQKLSSMLDNSTPEQSTKVPTSVPSGRELLRRSSARKKSGLTPEERRAQQQAKLVQQVLREAEEEPAAPVRSYTPPSQAQDVAAAVVVAPTLRSQRMMRALLFQLQNPAEQAGIVALAIDPAAQAAYGRQVTETLAALGALEEMLSSGISVRSEDWGA